ncbi:hypothetical protein [Streptomyces sp. NPDC001100]
MSERAYGVRRDEEFAARPYHQGDWKAIDEDTLAHAEADEDEDPERAEELYAMEHLTPPGTALPSCFQSRSSLSPSCTSTARRSMAAVTRPGRAPAER